jgi:hypothetical protein
MKLISFIFSFFLITENSLAQSWTEINKNSIPQLNFSLVLNPINIYGEINPAEIGVTGPGIGQYGVQGGGIASAFAMLAGHAISVHGQRSAQLEKLNQESKLFGKLLTERLNGISNDKFFKEVAAGMPEASSALVSVIDTPADNYSGFYIDYRYSVTRDYHGLILDISFAQKNKDKSIYYATVYQNKTTPYVGVSGTYDSPYEIRKDMMNLMEEAIRIFLSRDELVKKKSGTSVTFRSLIGKGKRFERGTLLSQSCDKHLFISLSEVWVSAPKLEKNNQDVLCNTGLNQLELM